MNNFKNDLVVETGSHIFFITLIIILRIYIFQICINYLWKNHWSEENTWNVHSPVVT